MLVFGTVECYNALTKITEPICIDFGTLSIAEVFNKMIEDVKFDYVVNFNSLKEGIPRLDALNPYWNNNDKQLFVDEMTFDNWYVNLITTSPNAFKQIVDIMRAIYNGKNVYILCDWSNEIAENMIEALIKFITDSYGYKCNIANNRDYIQLKEGDFSAEGIQLFDSNLETYIKMFGAEQLPSDHGDLA